MAELKQCPFCGDNQQLNCVELSNGLHYIECDRCGAAPHRLGAWNRETAVKYWNSVNLWIPCSERLPEDFEWCLVCMSDGCIRLGKWNGKYDDQGVWWVSLPLSGGKLYRIKNVPFWMPLPEPPERSE